jgi:ribosome maturation factor RimP
MKAGFMEKAWAGPALRCCKGRKAVSALTDAFERTIEAIVHERGATGVEIVAHTARTRRGLTELTVTIDKDGGVDLATCERIASRVNGALDAIAQPYSLEVESAGLDRPLMRPGDYERFAGKRARIVTSLSIAGGKTHRGTLVGLRGETVILATESGELPLPVATIKSANLEYDPRADLQRDKRERKAHGRAGS